VILVDTSALFAMWATDDSNHMTARTWYRENRRRPLFVSDYILDETLTLLRARGLASAAQDAGSALFTQAIARLEFLRATDVQSAWEVFSRFTDKAWSFTDCTSLVLMGRLGIHQAFAFDNHFRQFGTVTVVP
jgi:uncharacterized protein